VSDEPVEEDADEDEAVTLVVDDSILGANDDI
jgi:hypothetical protein